MEQAIAGKTIVAKNHGSQVRNWRKNVLFSCLIALACCGCQQPAKPVFDWVKISGGTCHFGTNDSVRAHDKRMEVPEILVHVNTFSLSATPVTNAQFEAFVEATGYVTEAERNHAGSAYYTAASGWRIDPNRNWRHPEGANSSIRDKMDHPVVCVTYNDVHTFCAWAGVRLPSEIEWEYACETGGTPTGMNIDPRDMQKTGGADHFETTAPVRAFPADQNGVFDLYGNTWEMCADRYHFDRHEQLAAMLQPTSTAYTGPSATLSEMRPPSPLYVIKGGSFLCCADYCHGYRSDARQSVAQNEAFVHIGFRVVRTH